MQADVFLVNVLEEDLSVLLHWYLNGEVRPEETVAGKPQLPVRGDIDSHVVLFIALVMTRGHCIRPDGIVAGPRLNEPLFANVRAHRERDLLAAAQDFEYR